MMTTTAIGPSLLDLQALSDTSIWQVSWFIGAKAAGAVVGAALLSRNGLFLNIVLNSNLYVMHHMTVLYI